jgi:4-carboxymuconolactone decarboxylase
MVCIPLILVTGICGIICTFASDKRIRIMMKKTITIVLWAMACINLNAQGNMKQVIKQTAGRNALGEFAPEFAHLNDDVLFGEVWNRQDELSLHQRSLVTVLSLMAQGITDSSLKYHLMTAKANGVTRQELSEMLTHAAFYCGWPKAWAVFNLAKEVWNSNIQTREEFQMSTPYPIGTPNDAYAKYFIGKSYLAPMDAEKGGPVNVTFEPACRNNWHIHHDCTQVLICVAGRGWYQEWGKKPVKMTPGTVIAIPAEAKHWHGAAKDSWFQHLTYTTKVGKAASNEWLEPVTDEVYFNL